jgi:protein phosphatase 2C family protein 2/3
MEDYVLSVDLMSHPLFQQLLEQGPPHLCQRLVAATAATAQEGPSSCPSDTTPSSSSPPEDATSSSGKSNDSGSEKSSSSSSSRAVLAAVCDGHAGHQAAEYVVGHLEDVLLSQGQALLLDPCTALQAAVQQLEAGALQLLGSQGCNAGCTLLALLVLGDTAYLANVGDCRAVLSRGPGAHQVVALTRDHKPRCEVEKARIFACDPAAAVSADGYLYHELAVARGLGSPQLKCDGSRAAFTAEPEMFTVELSPGDDFVVLASDGVWDKVRNSEAAATARRALVAAPGDADSAARALVERAMKLQSDDNVSAVVVLLHDRPLQAAGGASRLFRPKSSVSMSPSTPAAAGGGDGGSCGGVRRSATSSCSSSSCDLAGNDAASSSSMGSSSGSSEGGARLAAAASRLSIASSSSC